MFLQQIKLTNFKNYESLEMNFQSRVTAFVGSNGIGKTNLLDAIYYLCMTKSYFLTTELDVILKGKDFLRIEGDFVNAENTHLKIVAKVGTGRDFSIRRKKKIFENNDVAYPTLTEHIGLLRVVMLAPDDTELIKEGSEARRRFLDNTLSQLDSIYLQNLIAYNKLLEQRNATLKKLGDAAISYQPPAISNKTKEAESSSLLDVYEQQMLPCANYIFEARKKLIAAFTPLFNRFYNHIAGDEEKISICYESCSYQVSGLRFEVSGVSKNLIPQTSNLIPDFKNIWINSRSKDIILHRTTQGIHRDDLNFSLDDKPLKRFGSQGQLKSFITALKLAQFEMLTMDTGQWTMDDGKIENRKSKIENRKPILLLDDIFDKFDAVRLKNLLALLESGNYGQIFLTDTHIERINDLQNVLSQPVQIFKIDRAF